MSEKPLWQVVAALFTVYVVWGSTYLAIHFTLAGGFPPLMMGGSRFFLAGALMFVALRMRGVPAPSRRQWRNCAVMAAAMMLFANGAVTIAQQTVSSGITAVAVASSALWIALFAAVRGERISRLEVAGLVVGFAGIVLLNAGGELSASPVGLVCLIVSPVCWALGSVWARGRDLPMPFMTAAAQMLCSAPMMLAAGWLRGERFDGFPQSGGILAWLYLALFGSVIAYSAYVWLMQNVRPGLLGSYAYVNPVIAVALGIWLAGETVAGKDWLAMAVILSGVVMITLGKTVADKWRRNRRAK